jgi:hypothetical protein
LKTCSTTEYTEYTEEEFVELARSGLLRLTAHSSQLIALARLISTCTPFSNVYSAPRGVVLGRSGLAQQPAQVDAKKVDLEKVFPTKG